MSTQFDIIQEISKQPSLDRAFRTILRPVKEGPAVQFKCPRCGFDKMEEVRSEKWVGTITRFASAEKDRELSGEKKTMELVHFRCARCCLVPTLPGTDTWITDYEGLVKWIERFTIS